MFPYLDLAGFRIRTVVPFEFVDEAESFSPGWIAQNVSKWSSRINSQMRKRYGTAKNGGNLPFGQNPPALLAAGTTPPPVSLSGRPTLGSMRLVLQILTAGALGVATFQWSQDAGTTFTGPLTTAALVSLAGTGLQANFSATGSYATDNVYSAATPVPETVLGWLTDLVSWDLMCRRYRNSQDPAIATFKESFDRTIAEVQQAADAKDGLFDLPVSEDQDSAVTTGFPLFYSEASPYVWADEQRCSGRQNDHQRTGTGS